MSGLPTIPGKKKKLRDTGSHSRSGKVKLIVSRQMLQLGYIPPPGIKVEIRD